MSYTQNSNVLESTTSYATYKYVNKQRFRIFRAESEGESRKLYKKTIYFKYFSDKGLFEPYVSKGTRTVLERVRMSNHPILSN